MRELTGYERYLHIQLLFIFYIIGTGGSFPEINCPDRQADHSYAFREEVNNEWR